MMSRRIIVGAVGAAVLFGILPASAAQAQDDLVCVRSDTRLAKNPPGELGTTVVGYCAEWVWRPKAGGQPGDTRPGEHDPDGGKGGTPDLENCDSLKADLENAARQLDLFDQQIPAAEAAVDELTIQVAKDYAEREDTRETWINAQRRTDALRDVYILANDIDPVVYSPKAGVTITRDPSTYHINTSTVSGRALQLAVNAEATAKADHLGADDAWRHSSETLDRLQGQLDELKAQRAALLQAVEVLQSALHGRCK